MKVVAFQVGLCRGTRVRGHRGTRALFLVRIYLCSHMEKIPFFAGWSHSRTGEGSSAGSQGLLCYQPAEAHNSSVTEMQNKDKETSCSLEVEGRCRKILMSWNPGQRLWLWPFTMKRRRHRGARRLAELGWGKMTRR